MTLNMYSPVGCKCLAVDVYLFKTTIETPEKCVKIVQN